MIMYPSLPPSLLPSLLATRVSSFQKRRQRTSVSLSNSFKWFIYFKWRHSDEGHCHHSILCTELQNAVCHDDLILSSRNEMTESGRLIVDAKILLLPSCPCQCGKNRNSIRVSCCHRYDLWKAHELLIQIITEYERWKKIRFLLD